MIMSLLHAAILKSKARLRWELPQCTARQQWLGPQTLDYYHFAMNDVEKWAEEGCQIPRTVLLKGYSTLIKGYINDIKGKLTIFFLPWARFMCCVLTLAISKHQNIVRSLNNKT